MSKRRKLAGGALTVVGYVLSPLSWWNDMLINIPLSYLVASPFGLISKQLFTPAFVGAYWLTNLLGFMLMHLGVLQIRGKAKKTIVALIKENFPMTLIYTIVMVILVQKGIVKLPWEYLAK